VNEATLEHARVEFEALRAQLEAAAAARPPPLLHVPLLGTHEGTDAVMLAALLLWGDPEVVQVHAEVPYLTSLRAPHDVPTGGLLDVHALGRCVWRACGLVRLR
jgi:hypothetical protein